MVALVDVTVSAVAVAMNLDGRPFAQEEPTTGEPGTEQGGFRRFPVEIRLMIWKELLVFLKPIWRGAGVKRFGNLIKEEYDEEGDEAREMSLVPAAILASCRTYHDEAAPILYSMNTFNFCTGENGTPGYFERWPISARYIPYLRSIGIFFRSTDPKEQSSSRVAHFLRAVARRATNLWQLTICISSDRYYQHACPFDIPFPDHPVCQVLAEMMARKWIPQHLKLRFHDDTCFFPDFANFLNQEFRKINTEGQTLIFTRSCSCPPRCPIHDSDACFLCKRPRDSTGPKPIEMILLNPALAESGLERMMEMQAELFDLGILPPRDDDEEDDESETAYKGGYGDPTQWMDDYEENRPAFSSGLYCNHSGIVCECCSDLFSLLPGEQVFRGKTTAPKVWSYRQTKIPEYLDYIGEDEYWYATFH